MVIIGAAGGLGVVVVLVGVGVCCFVRGANRKGGGGGEVQTNKVEIKKTYAEVAGELSTPTHTVVEVEMDTKNDETKGSMPEGDFL